MEDKVFLDESGLGEVGKVINKFYASKDDLKDLDSLKSFVDSHNEIKLHYIAKEEYERMEEDDKRPRLADITDPISIVGIEQTSEGNKMWNDDPWTSLYTVGLDVESLVDDDNQKYLLFNITPNHKIISDKIDNVDFNETPLKDHDIRLQIAFGERDQCLYWRFLYDSKGDTGWIFIQDLYSKQNVNNLQARYEMLEKQFKGKVDKVEGKDLSTNDYTNEDKKKLDSINVEAINSADNSNVNTIKFCDVEKEVLIKGADAPIGLYIDNTQINSALKIYRIFIDEKTQNKSYRVEVLPLSTSISAPIPKEYSWQNNKWTQKVIGPPLTEPNSVDDQIFQLKERIERLESKIQK